MTCEKLFDLRRYLSTNCRYTFTIFVPALELYGTLNSGFLIDLWWGLKVRWVMDKEQFLIYLEMFVMILSGWLEIKFMINGLLSCFLYGFFLPVFRLNLTSQKSHDFKVYFTYTWDWIQPGRFQWNLFQFFLLCSSADVFKAGKAIIDR